VSDLTSDLTSESGAEQAVAVALRAMLDTDAAVAAITGRASGNIAPTNDDQDPPARGLAYDVGPTAPRDTVGEHYDVAFTIHAEAETRAAVRALLDAVKRKLTVAAFAAAGADACLDGPVSTTDVVRGESVQTDDPNRPRDVYSGSIEGTIWYTPPPG
jgi:hypothetical protein